MDHPITPPPELVRQWLDEWINSDESGVFMEKLATQSARWGADQELEACSEWLLNSAPWTVDPNERPEWVQTLKRCRRPKPPSLAEQALEALGPVPLPETGGTDDCFLNAGAIYRHDTIRAALERLKELEKGNE